MGGKFERMPASVVASGLMQHASRDFLMSMGAGVVAGIAATAALWRWHQGTALTQMQLVTTCVFTALLPLLIVAKYKFGGKTAKP